MNSSGESAFLFHITPTDPLNILIFVCRYFAFELCAANLQDWADSKYKGTMPSELVAIHQMALGLAFVHDKQHVHREICPANIFISIGGDRLVLSDFGLCKNVHASEGFSASRHNGGGLWLAPERMQKKDDPNYRVTIECDTWAMGCVFYFFITKGSHPFHDDPAGKMQKKIIKGTHNLESRLSILDSFTCKKLDEIHNKYTCLCRNES